MRIISPFHDYYDSAMGLAFDPSLIYQRLPVEVEVRPPAFLHEAAQDAIRDHGYLQFGPVYICVGTKGFLRWTRGIPLEFRKESVAHNLSSLASVTHSPPPPSDGKLYRGYEEFLVKRKTRRLLYDGLPDFRLEVLERFQAKHGQLAVPVDFIRAVGHPVFSIEFERTWDYRLMNVRVVANPRLASCGAENEMDAFSAFQEISMCLSGLLGREDKAPQRVGGDEVILRQKGFDEASFRSGSPGEKKVRRKLNRLRKRGLSDGS